jgi:hypothetical protein
VVGVVLVAQVLDIGGLDDPAPLERIETAVDHVRQRLVRTQPKSESSAEAVLSLGDGLGREYVLQRLLEEVAELGPFTFSDAGTSREFHQRIVEQRMARVDTCISHMRVTLRRSLSASALVQVHHSIDGGSRVDALVDIAQHRSGSSRSRQPEIGSNTSASGDQWRSCTFQAVGRGTRGLRM